VPFVVLACLAMHTDAPVRAEMGRAPEAAGTTPRAVDDSGEGGTGVAWPKLSSGPLQDNSFLIEEAYNQERGVVQHILSVVYDKKSGDWLGTFTQEWPVPDEANQLSFSVPYQWLGGLDGAAGVGDVLLNYRRQVLYEDERRPAFAPRLSLILPTGDEKAGLGANSTGVQVNLPFSKQVTPHFASHLNFGVTILPDAEDRDFPGRGERLTSWNGGLSLIWEPVDAINLLGELVASRDAEIGERGVDYRNRAIFNPGVRIGWNGPLGMQWVAGVAVPIGLTPATDDLGVFLYFSIEHAFTRAALADRRW
jgi:hypothetical protein